MRKQASCSPSPTSWQEKLLSRSLSCRGNTDLQEQTHPSVTAWLTPSVDDHFWNRWRRHVVTFLLSDGGVLAVGQRTGRAVTQPCDVVLITTEALTLRPEDTKKTRDVTWTSTVSNLQPTFCCLHQETNLHFQYFGLTFINEKKTKMWWSHFCDTYSMLSLHFYQKWQVQSR